MSTNDVESPGGTPENLMLTGFMCTGKSSVGQLVAPRLGLRFVDLDGVVEAREERSIAAIFRDEGEPYFRAAETTALREVLGREGQVIATGGGTLLRAKNRSLAGERALVICLVAAPDELVRRVAAAGGTRPLLAGAKDPEGRIRALLEEREPAYAAIPLRLDTTGKTPEQVAEEVVGLWQSLHPAA